MGDVAFCEVPMTNRHQPGEDTFRVIWPESVQWQPFAAFPTSSRLAVLVGNPSQPGPYLVRIRVAAGQRVMSLRHSEDRIYTVISGVFYVGLGERFEESELTAHAPGSVLVVPGGQAHFHWAKAGEYVVQVHGIGPVSLEYVNPRDDPRRR